WPLWIRRVLFPAQEGQMAGAPAPAISFLGSGGPGAGERSDEHHRTDLERHFADRVHRKPGAPRMFPDRFGVRGVILAIDLPSSIGDVASDPHDPRHAGEHLVRLLSSLIQ